MKRLAFLGVVALLAACGGSSSDGSGGDGREPAEPVALSALCAAWGEAWCRAAVVCGGVTEAQVPACAAVQASTCDQAAAEAQVQERMVAYDGESYRRCLDNLVAFPRCDEERRPQPFENDPDCAKAAVGKLADLADCGGGFGPFGNRQCAKGRCADEACGEGFCEPVPQKGQSCFFECAQGLRCLEGVCRPLAAEGEPCDRMEEECAAGLFCRAPEGSFDGTCSRPLPVGTVCDRYVDACEAGAYCPSMGDETTCTPRGSQGATCDTFVESCAEGFSCGVFGDTCSPQQPEGAACDWDARCLEPLRCVSGACARPPIVGEPCTPDEWTTNPCLTGWCDGTVCRPPLPGGAACTSNDECADHSPCVDGVCGYCW